MANGVVFEGNEFDALGFLAQKAWFQKHTMVSLDELAQEATMLRRPQVEEVDLAGLVRKGLIEEPVKGHFSVTEAGMRIAKSRGLLD